MQNKNPLFEGPMVRLQPKEIPHHALSPRSNLLPGNCPGTRVRPLTLFAWFRALNTGMARSNRGNNALLWPVVSFQVRD